MEHNVWKHKNLNSAVRSRLLQAIAAPSVLARATPRGLGLPCGELWFGTIFTWILQIFSLSKAHRVFQSCSGLLKVSLRASQGSVKASVGSYFLQIPGICWVGDYIAGALLLPCAFSPPAQLRAYRPLPREHWHSISSCHTGSEKKPRSGTN